MWPALSRWTEGGVWGRFFDNAPVEARRTSSSGTGRWSTWPGAAEHADLCEAALAYLLERMRLEIEDPSEQARLKLMVVDEAWRYLADPAVLAYLAEAAKTWRKKNAALVLATQSAVDVSGHGGRLGAAGVDPDQAVPGEPRASGRSRRPVPAERVGGGDGSGS